MAIMNENKMSAAQYKHFLSTGKLVSEELLRKHDRAVSRFKQQEAEKALSEEKAPSESLKNTLQSYSKEYTFEICPVSAPRMSSSDRWKTGKDKRPIVAKYHDFKDYLRFLTKKQNYTVKPVLKIEFYVEMPKSWSKKKKREMSEMPHQQKPDIDNFLKAFLDTLCKEDKFVWNVHALKFWSYEPKIKVFE